MSREVQGDAPADAGVPVEAKPLPGPLGRMAAPRPGWRRTGAVLALITATSLAGLGGWTAAGAWQPPQPPPPPEAVTAVAIEATADAISRPNPVRGRMLVRLTNPGDHPVSVVGFEPARDATFITGLDPRRLDVPAGGSAEVLLQVGVRCGSAAVLDLPGLRIRRPDGGLRPLPLTGAPDALAQLCAAWPGQEPLVVDQVHRDFERLAVVLRSPGGRTTRVQSVLAGAVPLTVTALPITVDGGDTTIWLQPPGRCPARWQQTGIPERLMLGLDIGGPAELSLRLGPALADWILATACRPGSL
jgi:hypothetical protein